MSYLLSIFTPLTSLNLSNFNTNNVKNMNEMFSYFLKITSLDLSILILIQLKICVISSGIIIN